MPIPGARYRVVETSKGNVRLAFVGDKVVEAKNMDTGETHSPAEFQADEDKKRRKASADGYASNPARRVR